MIYFVKTKWFLVKGRSVNFGCDNQYVEISMILLERRHSVQLECRNHPRLFNSKALSAQPARCGGGLGWDWCGETPHLVM